MLLRLKKNLPTQTYEATLSVIEAVLNVKNLKQIAEQWEEPLFRANAMRLFEAVRNFEFIDDDPDVQSSNDEWGAATKIQAVKPEPTPTPTPAERTSSKPSEYMPPPWLVPKEPATPSGLPPMSVSEWRVPKTFEPAPPEPAMTRAQKLESMTAIGRKVAETAKLTQDKTTGAVKADAAKLRFDLLPVKPIQDLVAVLNYGSGKYADRNWEKGMKWSRCYAALMRHMFSWWGGESSDPETGMSHLAHAACCLVFLMEYEYTKPEFDDRPSTEENK